MCVYTIRLNTLSTYVVVIVLIYCDHIIIIALVQLDYIPVYVHVQSGMRLQCCIQVCGLGMRLRCYIHVPEWSGNETTCMSYM